MYVRKFVCLLLGVNEFDGEVVGLKEVEFGRVMYINE